MDSRGHQSLARLTIIVRASFVLALVPVGFAIGAKSVRSRIFR